jgi:uncharacterized protein (UPF0333 family)
MMPTSPIRGIAIAAVLLCVCILAGCAMAPVASSEMDARAKSFAVAPGKANIYLYRNENLGGAVTMKVSVNGKEAGATGRATYFLWEVDPGTYEISSESENASSVRIVAEAGKSYYVWQEVKIGLVVARNALHAVDDETGRKGVSECARLQSKL